MSDRAAAPIIVVRHNALGDLLTALPALRAIRRGHPHHRLVMTCPRSLRPLAEELRLADSLLHEPADVAFDPVQHEQIDDLLVRQVLRHGVRPGLVVAMRVPIRNDLVEGLLALRPGGLLAYRHPGVDATAGMPTFSFEDHILTRWDRLLAPAGIRTDPADLHVGAPAPPPGLAGCTIIHVGAASASRRWPPERWARVAGALEAAGHHVVLTGSAHEHPLADRIRGWARLRPERNLAGTTGILDLAALVGSARIVLSTDTGLSHLATTYRRPAVTLFGPVPPAWWGPPPGYRLNRALWKGRLGEAYGPVCDPGLLEISAHEVLDAVEEVELPAQDPGQPR